MVGQHICVVKRIVEIEGSSSPKKMIFLDKIECDHTPRDLFSWVNTPKYPINVIHAEWCHFLVGYHDEHLQYFGIEVEYDFGPFDVWNVKNIRLISSPQVIGYAFDN